MKYGINSSSASCTQQMANIEHENAGSELPYLICVYTLYCPSQPLPFPQGRVRAHARARRCFCWTRGRNQGRPSWGGTKRRHTTAGRPFAAGACALLHSPVTFSHLQPAAFACSCHKVWAINGRVVVWRCIEPHNQRVLRKHHAAQM
jgi:hypothetical protein